MRAFDGHNDALSRLHEAGAPNAEFLEGDEGHLNLPAARAGDLAGGLFAVFPCSPFRGEDQQAGLDYARPVTQEAALLETMAMVQRLLALEQESDGALHVVRHAGELDEGALAAVLHLEGAEAIGADLDQLESLYELGLRSLGIATAKHIRDNFTAGRYPGLERVLQTMQREGLIVPVAIDENGGRLPGDWLVHAEDLALLDRIEGGAWEPRTSLLSPFDNMIRDRQRTKMLFGFEYRMEIYVPKAKRRYGYYVLPILNGDRLIGRVDPRMDRQRRRLIVNAVHAEPGAPPTRAAGGAVREAIEKLAEFTGAREIDTAGEVPAPWRAALR